MGMGTRMIPKGRKPVGTNSGSAICSRGARAYNRRVVFCEADEYVRESVEVVLEAGASLPAAAYVIAGEHRELTRPEPWDEQAFVEVDLSDYLERTRAWMATFPGADSE